MRPGVRIVSLVLIGLVTLALAPDAARVHAAEPDWASLPYFRHDYGGWFRIWTNEQTFANGVRIINGGDPGSAFNPYPGPTKEESQLPSEFQTLWAAKCQPTKEQVFKTTRKIYLPGNADKLQVSLGAYSYHSKQKQSPVDRIELLVNGIGVHQVKSSPGNPIPFATASRKIQDVTKEAHLVFGQNTFTVIAHKKPTKKALGWCTGDNKFGISAEVYGEHLADLVTTRAVGSGVYTNSGFFTDVTVTNKGPSVLVPGIVPGWGAFGTKVLGRGVTFKSLLTSPAEGCSDASPVDEYYGPGLALSCPLPQMEPGDAITFKVVGQYASSPPPPGYEVRGAAGAIGYGEGYGDTGPAEMQNNNVAFTFPTPSPSPP